MRAIERIVGFTILAMPGGLPILEDGRLLGAIGVSGSGAARAGGGGGLDEVLANAAVSPV
jgi:uncharacterized protein GlcG (DUF336 family)